MEPKRGSILILTLWTLSFLTIFAVGLAGLVSGQLHFSSHLQDRLKMYYLAKAGIERAITVLAIDQTPDSDTLNEIWSNSEEAFKEIPLDGGYVTVSYELTGTATDTQEGEPAEQVTLYGLMDESSRININKAPVRVLKTMLENIAQVEAEAASEIANSIVDWRDRDIIVSPGGAENSYYETLDAPYSCKNDDFQIPEELLLVKGMTAQIFSDLSDVITIYGDEKVNINTADCRTFCALGLSSALAERIVQFRRGADEIDGTEDDNIFETVGSIRNIGSLFTQESEEINSLTSRNLLTVKSSIFRINSFGILKKGERNLQRKIVCVVQRFPDKPTQLLYWQED